MRKGLAFLVAVIIVVTGFGGYNLTAYAGGWLPYAQDIELDTTYVDGLSQTDYWFNNDEVCDVFKFNIPEKGNVTFSMESEQEGYFEYTELRIYNVNNPDKMVWSKEDEYYEDTIPHKYSSARDVYYGDLSISLSKGTYYLVFIGSAYEEEYSFSLKYFPAIGAPKIAKLSRTSVSNGAGLRVIWDKSARANGYIIEISTSSKFTASKTQTIEVGKDVRSYIIDGLKHKKKYYVRMRACCTLTVTDFTWTYISNPSKVWKIKTK